MTTIMDPVPVAERLPSACASPTSRREQARALVAVAHLAYRSFDATQQAGTMRTHILTRGPIDRALEVAKGRGFRERRLVVGAARRGGHGEVAIGRWEAVLALLTAPEVDTIFADLARAKIFIRATGGEW